MHKFQEEMNLTYEEFFRRVLGTKVQILRALEQVLDGEEASEVIARIYEKIARNWVKQMTEKHPINSFDDFVAFMKKIINSPMRQHTMTVAIQRKPLRS